MKINSNVTHALFCFLISTHKKMLTMQYINVMVEYFHSIENSNNLTM